MSEAKASTGAALERLNSALTGFDSTLVAALDSNRRKIEY